MFFYVSDGLGGIVPFLFLFIILNFLLTIFMGGSRKRPPMPMPEEEEPVPAPERQAEQSKEDRDVIADFERRLQKQKAKVHTDNCGLPHSKAKLYTEPPLIKEEGIPAMAAAASVEAPVRKRLAHPRLADGFIMGQILDKPRSLKPYEGEF